MAYEIVYDREALADMKRLPRKDRVTLLAQIRRFLQRQPEHESKTRIRRLRGNVFPPYRLRIDPYRILYEVSQHDQTVVVHGIGRKPEIYSRLGVQEEGDR